MKVLLNLIEQVPHLLVGSVGSVIIADALNLTGFRMYAFAVALGFMYSELHRAIRMKK